MQWLIDIIAQRVIDTIGIPPVFIDRGDVASVDFFKANFVRDGFDHTLDLSAIVPDGAKAVLFSFYATAVEVGKEGSFRKHGNTKWFNASNSLTLLAGRSTPYDKVCPISSDRKLDYHFDIATWLEINFIVKGWWL